MNTTATVTMPLILANKSEYAYASLYEQYSPPLYGLIIKFAPDKETANNILRESFLKIWIDLDCYTLANGTLLHWMTGITMRQCRETLNLSKTQLLNKLMPKAIVLKIAN
jgi:DNA-directed RNA polymerase specialized sigma24 family protein